MAKEFGPHGHVINAILREMQEAEVKNARNIKCDGVLGQQFLSALAEMKTRGSDEMGNFTAFVRDYARALDINCRTWGMTTRPWGEHYDKFVVYLNEQAALEQRDK